MRRRVSSIHGLILVDKPTGPTSHDVVARARRALSEKRIGHVGTLDPMATGLLGLLVGAATRLSEYLVEKDKRYTATVRFGRATNTYDAEGETVAESGRIPERETLEAAVARFRGPQLQRPPAFSAIKRDGQRAYALARQGEEVVLEPRPVTIYEIDLIDWAPPPQPRDATVRMVQPTETPFSGFVFKIQANMDPKHRDRIAFFRVCSGRYSPGIKVRHLRTAKDIKIGNALTFMANERVASEDAVAGDIIGIHNHGQLQIGDTLTEGEALGFKGIPYFAPELFRSARPRDPFKAKQLQKGLLQIGEEGAIQVFETEMGNLLLGAVGPLQFEIVAQRLQTEYQVDAIYESADVSTARWLTFPDDDTRKRFEREQAARMARDVDGNPVYIATNRYNLQVTMEHWPKVGFLATREHGQRVAQG